jgi:hypothetical protein
MDRVCVWLEDTPEWLLVGAIFFRFETSRGFRLGAE